MRRFRKKHDSSCTGRAPGSALFAVLLLAGCLILAPAQEVFGAHQRQPEAALPVPEEEAAQTEGPVSLDVVYGYQNTAKSGRFLPLEVQLENRQQEAFEGTLVVTAMEPDYQTYSSGMNYDYDVYRYEYPVKLEAGESAVEHLSISLGVRVDQMYVSLLDSQGEEAARKRLKLNLNMETAELFIGVLSDTPDNMFYMNSVGIYYSTLRTRTIEMPLDSLPENELGLDQLDVLVITDFDTRQLSAGQREAVLDWVRSGGLLLIGTGARASDTLAAFRSELVEGGILPAQERQINMGVEFAVDSPSESEITLPCAELELRDGSEVFSSDELSVLSSVAVGNGQAAVAVFDFKDIRDFCQSHPDYVANLFQELLGEERISELSSSASGGGSNRFWALQSLVNTGDTSRLPRVGLYASVMAAYVVLIGPGLYFFLKQRDMSRYYHRSAAALAVCATGMILMMGTATRFKGPFFTYASICELDGTGETETLFVNMRAPYNRPYSVTLSPEYSVWPITGAPFYDRNTPPDFDGSEEPAITIRTGEDGTRISSANVGAFNSRFFQLGRRSEGTQGFLGTVSLFNGEIRGELTNNSGQALENTAILFYNQLVLIGSMAPGETVSLDGREVIYTATNNGYITAGRITGASLYDREGGYEDPHYAETMERMNLLSFYIDNYLSGYHADARVVAFGQDRNESGFLVGDDWETYGMTLLTSSMEVDYEQDGLVYHSAMQKEPRVVSGEYYAASNTIYGMSPVVLEYYLGNDLEVNTLNLHWLTGELEQNMSYYYMVPFSGAMYFYNYDTGNYDTMSTDRTEYSWRSLEPYLSPGNTLTVKYIYDGLGDYSWNIVLPVLTVTGGRK